MSPAGFMLVPPVKEKFSWLSLDSPSPSDSGLALVKIEQR